MFTYLKNRLHQIQKMFADSKKMLTNSKNVHTVFQKCSQIQNVQEFEKCWRLIHKMFTDSKIDSQIPKLAHVFKKCSHININE